MTVAPSRFQPAVSRSRTSNTRSSVSLSVGRSPSITRFGTFVHGVTLWLGDQQTISGVSDGLVSAVIVTRLFGVPLSSFRTAHGTRFISPSGTALLTAASKAPVAIWDVVPESAADRDEQ